LIGSSNGSSRHLWRHIPWSILGVVSIIAALRVWNLASASRSAPSPLWQSQIYWFIIGLCACAAMMVFDYRYLLRLAYPIYGFVLLLLVAVLLRGRAAMGAQRWLDFGPVHLQPSELMKIAIILVMARFFHEDQRTREGYSLFQLWLPALLLLLPVALVMKQPDLGTSMMIAAIAGSIVLVAKVRWKSLLVLGVSGLAAALLAWLYLLKDYQRKRILTFLDPEGDLLGAGYHASQSLIAVGSGREMGKGWGNGTQTQLSFLPEQHTDFVFSVWGEEHGFVGALILVGLYLVLLLLMLSVAATAREKFGSFLAVGVAAMIFWHVFINIGMVTGLLPVVGVTLPLMSYGGSSVLTNMIGLGLLLNVAMRRHLF
jgi:rod shape determining protein RodA